MSFEWKFEFGCSELCFFPPPDSPRQASHQWLAQSFASEWHDWGQQCWQCDRDGATSLPISPESVGWCADRCTRPKCYRKGNMSDTETQQNGKPQWNRSKFASFVLQWNDKSLVEIWNFPRPIPRTEPQLSVNTSTIRMAFYLVITFLLSAIFPKFHWIRCRR